MFANEYFLPVDLKKKVSSTTPIFVQYDSATLLFKVFDNGKPFDMSTVTKIEVVHKRPDNKVVMGYGELIPDGQGQHYIRYAYIGNEMGAEGYNETSLSIYSTDKKVSIQPFNVLIVSDLKDALIENSKEEMGILQQLIARVENLADTANTAATNAEKAVADAVKAVAEANTAKVTAETAANEATRAKDEAVLATTEANKAVIATNLAKDAAILATTNAVTATSGANLAANNANNKAGLAEQSASKVDNKLSLVDQKLTEMSTTIESSLTAKEQTETATQSAINATSSANTAAELANQKAADAQNAAQNADTKALLAEEKASLANTSALNADSAKARVETVLPNIEGWENKKSYDPTVQYVKHNIVTYNGSTYQALTNVKGISPDDTSKWIMMAQRGVDGKGAVSSVNNKLPDENGNVVLSADELGIHNHTNKNVLDGITENSSGDLQYKGNLIGSSQVVMSSTAPTTITPNMFWIVDLGEDDEISIGEGGLIIGNASTDGTQPIFFDENI